MQMPGHRMDGNHCREATQRNQELPQKKSLLVKSLLVKSGVCAQNPEWWTKDADSWNLGIREH
jgi:hypothetical protein